ncbi:DUF4238 domain-containing protein [Zobellia galactanivorans]|uniref:DUF4238 domain-containing protein n=1 Tax=Zobellia galactanivorans (strain DSM 12802 / CCUG 47099 / CIP 106680 / NCIMB 13871 / Dsij) TaxID=63186 RepID=G0L7D3_ZOBGA|nr:DUF4238 domain-containing protein [Zobellia galactanivorans]CAZ97331.1 Hypothetical protein ZOBELLIA_3193 [Zobellia galactanivorans]
MKNHPEIQKQHRLSQVYLKKFGYQEDEEWMVSIMELGKGKTENVKISEFTAEENVFDLPFKDFELRRHFETLSGRLESDYNRLINNIENQKRLTPKDKDLLNHFVPNILCRTTHFRFFIRGLIDNIDTRKKLLNEITIFKEDEGQTEFLLNILKPETHLNIVVGTLMNHMVYVFRHFKKIVLKSPKGYGWLTSDNPIYIDFQEKHEWIIPIESELYFPLSKEYCVFLFHQESELKSNPLRNLRQDRINQIDFNLFDKLANKIARNLDKYLVFSERYEPTIIRE